MQAASKLMADEDGAVDGNSPLLPDLIKLLADEQHQVHGRGALYGILQHLALAPCTSPCCPAHARLPCAVGLRIQMTHACPMHRCRACAQPLWPTFPSQRTPLTPCWSGPWMWRMRCDPWHRVSVPVSIPVTVDGERILLKELHPYLARDPHARALARLQATSNVRHTCLCTHRCGRPSSSASRQCLWMPCCKCVSGGPLLPHTPWMHGSFSEEYLSFRVIPMCTAALTLGPNLLHDIKLQA